MDANDHKSSCVCSCGKPLPTFVLHTNLQRREALVREKMQAMKQNADKTADVAGATSQLPPPQAVRPVPQSRKRTATDAGLSHRFEDGFIGPPAGTAHSLLRRNMEAAGRIEPSYLHQAFVECPADIDLDMGAVRAHVASLGLSALAYAAEDDGVCVDFAKASLLDAFLAAPPPSGAKVMRSWRCTQVPRLRYYLDAQTAWQVNRQSLVQEVGCVEVDKATNVLHFVRPEDATAAYLMHNGRSVNRVCKLTLKPCER